MRLSMGRRGLCSGLALIALALAGCGEGEPAGQSSKQGAQQQPPRQAQVITVQPRDLQLDKDYPALLSSKQEVTVTARVTGVVEARHYAEGAQVEKGQLLFTIEPDRYEAAVRQRQADRQSAKAELSRAQRNWERYQQLYEQNSVSQQQLDEARATLQTARAAVAQTEAALDDAQIDLDYATVEAPVTGQISLSYVNVGSLVQPPQELATITPLATIEARFSLPEEDAIALRHQRRLPEAPEVSARLRAPAMASSIQNEGLVGRIDYLGARVDESTSTVQAEAVFDNAERLYLPGQFVRVALEGLQRFQVLAVPEVAVTEGLKGPQVYVLDENDTARSRFVDLGEQAGAWQIITDNLQAGERVVVSAIGSISAGDTIDPQPFDGNAEMVQQQEASQSGAAPSGATSEQNDQG